MDISIIYEDRDIIVCQKQGGIAVQTPRIGQQDMVSILKNYRVLKKEEPYIGIIHRLDQPVEGVMVFAKTKAAAASLSKQIAQRTTDKYYLAVVQGKFAEQQGVLEHDLVRDGRNNLSRVAKPGEKDAKHARLSYEVLEYQPEADESLVRIHLDTGRHHQIRVQMAAIGHPLVGDQKYNPQAQRIRGNVALCSCEIAFAHPSTGKREHFRIVPSNPFFGRFTDINV